MRGEGGLDQEGSSKNGSKWLVSEYIFESRTRYILKDLLTDWKGTKNGFKVFLDLPTGRLEKFQTKMDNTIDQILGRRSGRLGLRGLLARWRCHIDICVCECGVHEGSLGEGHKLGNYEWIAVRLAEATKWLNEHKKRSSGTQLGDTQQEGEATKEWKNSQPGRRKTGRPGIREAKGRRL